VWDESVLEKPESLLRAGNSTAGERRQGRKLTISHRSKESFHVAADFNFAEEQVFHIQDKHACKAA
jgi:hypothetical protein